MQALARLLCGLKPRPQPTKDADGPPSSDEREPRTSLPFHLPEPDPPLHAFRFSTLNLPTGDGPAYIPTPLPSPRASLPLLQTELPPRFERTPAKKEDDDDDDDGGRETQSPGTVTIATPTAESPAETETLGPSTPRVRGGNPRTLLSHSISLEPPTPIDTPQSLPFSATSAVPPLPGTSAFLSTLPPIPSSPSPSLSPSRSSTRTSLDGSLSPSRSGHTHHRRSSSSHSVKETLNAFEAEETDGTRIVNQYLLKGVIGSGSYAVVERATDRETGIEYAIKEFSKSRLRRRIATEAGRGKGRRPFKVVVGQAVPADEQGPENLSLISEFNLKDEGNESRTWMGADQSFDDLPLAETEVAIMKKVRHPNLCSIHEVIDVTSADSLLVVLELCEGGPITHVSETDSSPPIPEDRSRSIFRQIVLGLAYLHENGIVHRDIKPDNCLFLADLETVKIVDFGISEMFMSQSDDTIDKSAGSPAFMAPELCVPKLDGQLHGFACDMWSLGATLFALATGTLPWVRDNVIELYSAINHDPFTLPPYLSAPLQSLLLRLLDKSPTTRLTMKELWTNEWLTSSSRLPMMPYEENCAQPIEDPTCAEVDNAVRVLRSSILVARIAGKWKKGVLRRRSESTHESEREGGSAESVLPTSMAGKEREGKVVVQVGESLTMSPISSPALTAVEFHRAAAGRGTQNNGSGRGGGVGIPERSGTGSSLSTLDSLKLDAMGLGAGPGVEARGAQLGRGGDTPDSSGGEREGETGLVDEPKHF